MGILGLVDTEITNIRSYPIPLNYFKIVSHFNKFFKKVSKFALSTLTSNGEIIQSRISMFQRS